MRAWILFALVCLSGCASTPPMDDDMKQEFQRQLTSYLKQLPSTWTRLEGQGLTSETRVKLDFAYSIPDKDVATKLATMLQSQFSYTAEVQSADEGYKIQGRTGETTITSEILEKWLGYMVQRAVESGGRFDGWGVRRTDSGGK